MQKEYLIIITTSTFWHNICQQALSQFYDNLTPIIFIKMQYFVEFLTSLPNIVIDVRW
jgi:hypothetical protein